MAFKRPVAPSGGTTTAAGRTSYCSFCLAVGMLVARCTMFFTSDTEVASDSDSCSVRPSSRQSARSGCDGSTT